MPSIRLVTNPCRGFFSKIFEAEVASIKPRKVLRGGEIYGHVSKVGMSLVSFYCNLRRRPADEEFWTIPCFREQFEMGLSSAEGHAIEGLGTLQLATFIALHRSGVGQ